MALVNLKSFQTSKRTEQLLERIAVALEAIERSLSTQAEDTTVEITSIDHVELPEDKNESEDLEREYLGRY